MISFAILALAQVAGEGAAPASQDIFSPPPPPPVSGTAAPSRRAQGAVPLSNPGGWVGTADYPAEALRAMREGAVGFTLEIGVDGVPRGCAITQSSGDPSLDGATCTLIPQRARFRPARDAAGRAVAGSFSSRVVWKVPRTQPQPQEGELVISYTVGMDGKLRDCRIEAASGSAAPAATAPSPCQLGMGTTPYRDASGAPVARRVTMRHRVSVAPLPHCPDAARLMVFRLAYGRF